MKLYRRIAAVSLFLAIAFGLIWAVAKYNATALHHLRQHDRRIVQAQPAPGIDDRTSLRWPRASGVDQWLEWNSDK